MTITLKATGTLIRLEPLTQEAPTPPEVEEVPTSQPPVPQTSEPSVNSEPTLLSLGEVTSPPPRCIRCTACISIKRVGWVHPSLRAGKRSRRGRGVRVKEEKNKIYKWLWDLDHAQNC